MILSEKYISKNSIEKRRINLLCLEKKKKTTSTNKNNNYSSE